jgi:hypothetical protein
MDFPSSRICSTIIGRKYSWYSTNQPTTPRKIKQHFRSVEFLLAQPISPVRLRSRTHGVPSIFRYMASSIAGTEFRELPTTATRNTELYVTVPYRKDTFIHCRGKFLYLLKSVRKSRARHLEQFKSTYIMLSKLPSLRN